MIGEEFIDFIKRFEGFSNKAYKDVDKYAIGYGCRYYFDQGDTELFAVHEGDRIDEYRADRMLRAYLRKAEYNLKKVFPTFDRFPKQLQYALLDHAYNYGMHFTSTLRGLTTAVLRAAEDGQFTQKELEDIAKNIKPGRKDPYGLRDRRSRDLLLALGIYDFDDNITINSGKNNSYWKVQKLLFNKNKPEVEDVEVKVETPKKQLQYNYLNSFNGSFINTTSDFNPYFEEEV